MGGVLIDQTQLVSPLRQNIGAENLAHVPQRLFPLRHIKAQLFRLLGLHRLLRLIGHRCSFDFRGGRHGVPCCHVIQQRVGCGVRLRVHVQLRLTGCCPEWPRRDLDFGCIWLFRAVEGDHRVQNILCGGRLPPRRHSRRAGRRCGLYRRGVCRKRRGFHRCSGRARRLRGFPALRGQRAGVCLTWNDSRKSRKVIILYSIFTLYIVFFFSFLFFIRFKGEAAFPGARLCQRQLDRMVNDIEHVIFPGKAGFDLCRVDIDVHKIGGHFQQQDAARELALHGRALKGHFHARHDGAVAHIAAIDVEMLHTAAGAATLGWGDQAGNPVQPFLGVHLDKVTAELPPQHRVGGAAQLTIAGGDVLQLAFPDEFDADLRVAERHVPYVICHKGALAGVLFEELHAGGGVVEQILHPDGGAHSTGGRLPALLLAAGDAVAGGKLVRLGAGEQLYPRYAGNGSQCLTPEPQRMDAVQVIRLFNFAGGVADESRWDILGINTGAVIADLDQLYAAGFNADGDLRCTGIDGVFQQFLDHRCRALHHLTGGDQLRSMLIQNMDDCHGLFPPLWLIFTVSRSGCP